MKILIATIFITLLLVGSVSAEITDYSWENVELDGNWDAGEC